MNARSPVPPKIRLIIPLMESSIDAEVLSACRAAGRVLRSAGLDFQSLADSIDTALVSTAEPYDFGPVPPHRPRKNKPSIFNEKQQARQQRVARWCVENDYGRLTEAERRFVVNLAAYHREPSIEQADRLDEIADKLESKDRHE